MAKLTTRKNFTREEILRAMRNTRSNRAAARFLRCNYKTYKKYALMYTDEASGKSLYELHSNPSGKGIKHFKYVDDEPELIDILRGKVSAKDIDIKRFKDKLIREGYLEQKCYRCHFNEERAIDRKIPIILNFKDKNRLNLNISNLEFLCYNCFFIHVDDIFSERDVRELEDYSVEVYDKNLSDNLELDRNAIEQLKKAGLWEEDLDSPDIYLDTI